jgi:hypothetical protein
LGRGRLDSIDGEFDAADTQPVTGLERRAFYATIVHIGAIGAVEVYDRQAVLARFEAAMKP